MGGYYTFDGVALCFEFISDLIISILFAIEGIYFTARLIRNLKQQYIDLLKVAKLVIVLVISLRFLTHFIISIFLNKNQTKPFLKAFDHFFYVRHIFISLTQFSWYILIEHIKTYKMMSFGNSYSECKAQVKKTERSGVLIIIIINVTINLIATATETYGSYYYSALMIVIDDVIYTIFSICLVLNEYYLHHKLISTMRNCLHFHYQKYKQFIRFLTIFNYCFLIEMIIWLLCEISLTFACGSENTNQCDDFNYNFIHVFVLISKSISSVLFVIYLAFHTKNIRFSEWMYDILKGHRLCSKYEECSIFIKKSCCLRRNEKDHLMETPCTINEASMETNEETTVLDYDTSNHYMKSYLEEYQK